MPRKVIREVDDQVDYKGDLPATKPVDGAGAAQSPSTVMNGTTRQQDKLDTGDASNHSEDQKVLSYTKTTEAEEEVELAADDETGAVTIPTEVAEGTSIWMTRRDYRKIAAGVDRLAGQIKDQLGDIPAKLIFQFDCAVRGKMIIREQQKLQLQEILRHQIGADVPWLGFYTFGEIGPVGERNYFHNFTAVVAAIY